MSAFPEPAWLEVIEVPPGAPAPSDAVERIWRHELGGIVLRETIPRDLLARACARLVELDAPPEVRMAPVVSKEATPIMEVLGRSLRLSPWDEYLAALEPVRALHARLFEEPEGLEALLRDRIATANAGVAPVPLAGASGHAFARALVSTVRAGGRIPFHFDNYCFYEPTEFPRAAASIRDDTLINAFTLLQRPTRGGLLRLVALDWDEYRRHAKADARAWSDDLVEGRPRRAIELEPGDTLVFDAGRIAHEVELVEGEVPRHGYVFHMGRSRDSGQLRYFV